MSYTLGELAELTNAELRGDPSRSISAIATLNNAGPNQLSFFTNSRYRQELLNTTAEAVVISYQEVDASPVDALVVDNPRAIYAQIAKLLYPEPQASAGCHPSATVSDDATIDPTASIGANCFIDRGASIGAGVQIGPGSVISKGVVVGAASRLVANVTLCDGVCIGERVLLHPGVVIGGDGFGLANNNGVWEKVPQIGSVTVGDDVEIGANTTVDRGALEDTVIEEGVKLDNLIQVAHNAHIGAHTAIAACTGIAGSAKIGKRCTIAGAAVVVGHIEIVDDVHISCMSVVTKSIRHPGSYSSGSPLQESGEWRKNAVRMKQLDAMARKIKALEDR
ncbi:UDP-3-O-(3-hydroxymyristoyl)glucosamine N-acyltransferase [Solemya pervernicosa gill symbiont]|uniref:UDP-3-O-acylglucosamine N-acyltransferase n=2 Tax=Gammaproteobacteria incertae sedis TaxID=118884 RepID=A0A1T2L7Z7_9GAMM|nr:UDP-3-O-(3-hydroxymyristoyl)glucosamine N-acyltransferase [Candidatus Reidiella endopervernicosa]OOZ41190.1 UDP-3-O-(3-hydroxymyristoyl)glucosamine N-acyltransferase [Solemya pervernicosa gill symbiont]QKQ27085.1 UDP-3-O-(3-hydroxymyristoyl)glucosamine N-acyltransferase [Candidatus Reidiella endopervernicosa]